MSGHGVPAPSNDPKQFPLQWPHCHIPIVSSVETLTCRARQSPGGPPRAAHQLATVAAGPPWRRARVAVRPVRPRGRPDPRRKTGGPFSFLFGSAAYYVPRRTHPCDHIIRDATRLADAYGRGGRGGGGAAQTINTDHVNESRRRNPARLWTEDPAPGPLRRRRVNVCSAVHPASHRGVTVNFSTAAAHSSTG